MCYDVCAKECMCGSCLYHQEHNSSANFRYSLYASFGAFEGVTLALNDGLFASRRPLSSIFLTGLYPLLDGEA